MKKNVMLITLTVAAFFTSVVGAFGLTLTVTGNSGQQTTTTNLTTWNGTVNLAKFNLPGYHLTSINAILGSQLYGNLTVTRATANSTISVMRFESDFSYVLPSVPGPTTTYTNQNLQNFTPLPTVINPGQPSRTITVAQATPLSATTSVAITDPTLLALFTGIDNYAIPVSIYSNDLVTATSTPTQTRSHTALSTITLEYTYELNPPPPVPEPSTFILLGAGLGGLALLRMRARKQ